MPALSTTAPFDRTFLLRLADWLAVGVAVALPWSTTATGILIAVWLVVLLPTLNAAAVKRELVTAAGGLPVLLWCLGAIGMLWADAGWTARWQGLDGFNRLLMIPLLLAQFRRSGHGGYVVRGFFISSAIVLAVSLFLVLAPGLTWRGVGGVPVHDDIYQSSAFLICAFGALGCAGDQIHKRHWPAVLGLLAIAILFIASFVVVEISRIALIVVPVLVVLLGWRLSRWRGILGAAVIAVIIGAAFWFASSSLRLRLHDSIDELREYSVANAPTDLGMHAAFLKESLSIIAVAPMVGHGTGSIPEQFRRISAGKTGASAIATVNPHNQTFAVAIQLGLVGAVVLWAMWMAHFLLFRGEGAAAWLGTVVVVENIVSSTAHSHLFDFNNGWLYVFGVGVLGGMTLRKRAADLAKPAPAKLA